MLRAIVTPFFFLCTLVPIMNCTRLSLTSRFDLPANSRYRDEPPSASWRGWVCLWQLAGHRFEFCLLAIR